MNSFSPWARGVGQDYLGYKLIDYFLEDSSLERFSMIDIL